VDIEKRRVTVQGGMRLHRLHLQEHHLALSNLGSISEQSIAGVISTATHGTGVKYGVLSSLVGIARLGMNHMY
jgi:L-gulonolactone oxidase